MFGLTAIEFIVLFFVFALSNVLRSTINDGLKAKRLSSQSYNQIGTLVVLLSAGLIILAFLCFAAVQWNMSFAMVEQIFMAVPAPRMFVVVALTIIALEVLYAGFQITKIKPAVIAEQDQKMKHPKSPLFWRFFPVVMILIVFYVIFAPMLAEHRILESGVPGKAKILDIQPTGTIVNEQPKVRIFLEVLPAQGERYETKVEMVISPVYLPQFQPGAELNIKIDPNDKSRVAVESFIKERR
jgi:hypothetical protein